MESGTGELSNQGETGATDKSDLNAFVNGYRRGNADETWWRANFALAKYYGDRKSVV